MKIFVINLPHRKDKKENMLRQAAECGLCLEVVDAVNGKAFSDDDLKQLAYDYPACCMTPGVIGCALSHLKIYKNIIEGGHPYALVLEDDAILGPELKEVLTGIERLNYDDPHIWLLSSHYYKKKAKHQLTEKYAVHKFIDGSQGHGYVVSRKAAAVLCDRLQPIKWEADKWYYFEQMGLVTVDCVVPHVIPVDGVAERSDLYHDRALSNRRRRKYLRKLRKEVGTWASIKKLCWKGIIKPFLQKS